MDLEGFGKTTKEKVHSTPEKFKTKEGDITLKWNIFKPDNFKKGENIKPDRVVIFLPGVGLDSDSSSVVESAQDFANASKTISYSISTRTDNPKIENSQAVQAEAIRQFMISHNLQEVTLVGNSQGANKAIELAAILEKEEGGEAKIQVRGLILTNPAGLYEQDSKTMKTNFTKDALINTPQSWLKKGGSLSAVGRTIRVGADIGVYIAKEIVTAPGEFTDRANREAKEASMLNNNTAEIKAPVVVVLGADDLVFDSKKIIPDDSHGLHEDHDKRLALQNKRNEALKKIFPNSSNIKVLEATKSSTHGLHYARSRTVANASIEMLKRMSEIK
ncbi:MAG: alpha/beta hydrolase [Candidatus Paceibacterota bacterium]